MNFDKIPLAILVPAISIAGGTGVWLFPEAVMAVSRTFFGG